MGDFQSIWNDWEAAQKKRIRKMDFRNGEEMQKI